MFETTLYRTTKTKRGFTYRYIYIAPTTEDKPFLLFLHGFPSTSYDWRHQIKYFGKQGYGLIVPDMLGYAGTDKPDDPIHYVPTSLARDVIDIVDAEKAHRVIAIAHDWGCATLSCLALLHADRFMGFAWLAVGIMVPDPDFEYYAFCKKMRALTGSELVGYWETMDKDTAPDLFKEKIDVVLTLLYATDPSIGKDAIRSLGSLDKYLQEGSIQSLHPWLSEEEYEHMKSVLLDGGWRGPTNYYRVMVRQLFRGHYDDLDFNNVRIPKPIFFGGALRDFVCLAEPAKMTFQGLSEDFTAEMFDAGHWLMLAKANEVNAALGKWIQHVIDVDH
ncbi:alpha/beta-hydrolase [Fistulina hepatica ATCC 64428]|uniref:Alpha/beta-hydrolase n=1 Tax=Fistulina hepatica ATCC 64428 TaxID=1128425 RepID=A0A0D7A628_9AGAR|nr:alpha/beta-hydrolase [Fistulina hepatica ATCC 64428]